MGDSSENVQVQEGLRITPSELEFSEVEPDKLYSGSFQVANNLPTPVDLFIGGVPSDRYCVSPSALALTPGEEKTVLVELRIRKDIFYRLGHRKSPIRDVFILRSDFFEQQFRCTIHLMASAKLPPKPPTNNSRIKDPVTLQTVGPMASAPRAATHSSVRLQQSNTELVEHNRILRAQLDSLRTELASVQTFKQALALAEEQYASGTAPQQDTPAMRSAVAVAVNHVQKGIEEKDGRVVQRIRKYEERIAGLVTGVDSAEQEARRSADRARITEEQLHATQEDLRACTSRVNEAEERMRSMELKANRYEARARELDTELQVKAAEWTAQLEEKQKCIDGVREEKELVTQQEHAQVSTLRTQVAALKAELDLARVDEQAHTTRLRDVEDREQSMYSVIEQYSTAAAEAERSLREKDEALVEKDEALASQAQQIGELQSNLISTKQQLQQVNEELQCVQEKLTVQSTKAVERDKSIRADERLHTRLSDLEALYASAQEAMHEAQRSSHRHAAIAHRLAGQLSSLELEYSTLKQEQPSHGDSASNHHAHSSAAEDGESAADMPEQDLATYTVAYTSQPILQVAYERYARAEQMVRNLTFRLEKTNYEKDEKIAELKREVLLAKITPPPASEPTVAADEDVMGNDVEHLKAQIARWTIEAKRAHYAFEEAELRATDEHERCSQLRALLEDKVAQANDLSQEVANLTEQLGEAVAQANVHAPHDKQEPACTTKIRVQDEDIERLHAELRSLQAQLDQREQERAEARAEADQQAEAAARAENDRLRAQQAENELRENRHVVATAEAAVRDAESARALLGLEVEQQRMATQAAQQESAVAHARALAMEKELHAAQERQVIVDRAQAVQALEREGTEHSTRVHFETENARLQRALDSVTSREGDLRELLSQVQAERDSARSHSSILEAQIHELREAAVAEQRAHGHDIDVARITLEEREAQLRTLRTSLDKLQSNDQVDSVPSVSSQSAEDRSEEQATCEPSEPEPGVADAHHLPFGTVLLDSLSGTSPEQRAGEHSTAVKMFSDSVAMDSQHHANGTKQLHREPEVSGAASHVETGVQADSAENHELQAHVVTLTAQLAQAHTVEGSLQRRIVELHSALEERGLELRRVQASHDKVSQELDQSLAEVETTNRARRSLAERVRADAEAVQSHATSLHNVQMAAAREQQLAVLKAVAEAEERAQQVTEERCQRMQLERTDLEAQIKDATRIAVERAVEAPAQHPIVPIAPLDEGVAGPSIRSFLDPLEAVGYISQTRKGVVLTLKALLSIHSYSSSVNAHDSDSPSVSSRSALPESQKRIFTALQSVILDLDSQLHNARISLVVANAECKKLTAERDARALMCERLQISLAMSRSHLVTQLRQASNHLIESEKSFAELHQTMQQRTETLDEELDSSMRLSFSLQSELTSSRHENNQLRASMAQLNHKLISADSAVRKKAVEQERSNRLIQVSQALKPPQSRAGQCASCCASNTVEEIQLARADAAQHLYDTERARADALGGVVLQLEAILDGYLRREHHAENSRQESDHFEPSLDMDRYHVVWLHAPRDVLINRLLQADRDVHSARLAAVEAKHQAQRRERYPLKEQGHQGEGSSGYHSDPGHDSVLRPQRRMRQRHNVAPMVPVASIHDSEQLPALQQEVKMLREHIESMGRTHGEELKFCKMEADGLVRSAMEELQQVQVRLKSLEQIKSGPVVHAETVLDIAPSREHADDAHNLEARQHEKCSKLLKENELLAKSVTQLELELRDSQQHVGVFRDTVHKLEDLLSGAAGEAIQATEGDAGVVYHETQVNMLRQEKQVLAHQLAVSKATECDALRSLEAASKVEKQLRGLLTARNERIRTLRGAVDRIADQSLSNHSLSFHQSAVSKSHAETHQYQEGPWYPVHRIAAPDAPPSADLSSSGSVKAPPSGDSETEGLDADTEECERLRARMVKLEAEVMYLRSKATSQAPALLTHMLKRQIVETPEPPPRNSLEKQDGSVQQQLSQIQATLHTCQLARRAERNDLQSRVRTLVQQREHLRDRLSIAEGEVSDALHRVSYLEQELEKKLETTEQATLRYRGLQDKLDSCTGELAAAHEQLDTLLESKTKRGQGQVMSDDDRAQQVNALKSQMISLEDQLATFPGDTGSPGVEDNEVRHDLQAGLKTISELAELSPADLKQLVLKQSTELQEIRSKFEGARDSTAPSGDSPLTQSERTALSKQLSDALQRASEVEQIVEEMQAQCLKNRATQDQVAQLYEFRIEKLKERVAELRPTSNSSRKPLHRRKAGGSVQARPIPSSRTAKVKTSVRQKRVRKANPDRSTKRNASNKLEPKAQEDAQTSGQLTEPHAMDKDWLEFVLSREHGSSRHPSHRRASDADSGAPSWINHHSDFADTPQAKAIAINSSGSQLKRTSAETSVVAILTQRIVTLSSELRLAHSQAEKIAEELEQREADVASGRAECGAAQSAVDGMQRDMNNMRREAEIERDSLQNDIADLERELRRRKTPEEWSNLQARLRSVRESLRAATDEAQRRAKEVLQLKSDRDSLREQMKLFAANPSSSPVMASLDLGDENGSTDDRHHTSAKRLREKDATIRNLREKVADLNDSIADAVRSREVDRARINALQGEAARKDAAARAYKARLPELQHQVEAERSAREAALKSIASLKQDIVRREAVGTGLRSKLESSGAEVASWRGKYEAMHRAHREEIGRLELRSSELSSQIDVAEAQAREYRELIKAYVKQLADEIPNFKTAATTALEGLEELRRDSGWMTVEKEGLEQGGSNEAAHAIDPKSIQQPPQDPDILLAGSMVGLSPGDIAGILDYSHSKPTSKPVEQAKDDATHSLAGTFVDGSKKLIEKASDTMNANMSGLLAALGARPTVPRHQVLELLHEIGTVVMLLHGIAPSANLVTTELKALGRSFKHQLDELRTSVAAEKRRARDEAAKHIHQINLRLQHSEERAHTFEANVTQLRNQLEICQAEGQAVVARYEAKMTAPDLESFDHVARTAALQGMGGPAPPVPPKPLLSGTGELFSAPKDGGVTLLKHPPGHTDGLAPALGSLPLIHEFPILSSDKPTSFAASQPKSAPDTSNALANAGSNSIVLPASPMASLDAGSVLSFPDLDNVVGDAGRGSIDSLFETLRVGLQAPRVEK